MNRLTFCILVMSCMLSSCLDQLDLQVQKGLEEGVVIRAELVKGNPSKVTVNTGGIFNFDVKTLSPKNAQSVFLLDEKGNEIELQSKQDRIHFHIFDAESDAIKVEFGQKYKIKVIAFDGQIYESIFEELVPKVEKGQLKFERSTFNTINEDNRLEERPAVQFLIDTSIKPKEVDQNVRLLWFAERSYQLTDFLKTPDFISKTCYVTVNLNINNIHVLDGTGLTIDQVENYPLSKVLLNYEFAEGYYYTIYQRTVSKEIFEYWKQTKQVIERTGNMLEPPVGRISTNFYNVKNPKDNTVFGYFTVYAQDTLRLCVTPDEVGNPSKLCPPFVAICPQICCDCRGEPGSVLEKPFFWKK